MSKCKYILRSAGRDCEQYSVTTFPDDCRCENESMIGFHFCWHHMSDDCKYLYVKGLIKEVNQKFESLQFFKNLSLEVMGKEQTLLDIAFAVCYENEQLKKKNTWL